MNDWILAVIVGVALGAVIGVKVSRDSIKKEPVRGGTLPQVMNYLASTSLTSVLPFVIAGLVVGLRFLTLFGTALGLIALTAVFLLIFGAVEPPVIEAEEGAPAVLGN